MQKVKFKFMMLKKFRTNQENEQVKNLQNQNTKSSEEDMEEEEAAAKKKEVAKNSKAVKDEVQSKIKQVNI